jgi:hypothetical protein
MKNIRRLFATFSAVAVMSGLFGSPAAQAVDGKLYPGSSCVRFAGSTAVLPTLVYSELFNPATTVLSLDCPVVHDSINFTIQSGYVDVIDQNFAGDALNDANTQVCAALVSFSQALSSGITFKSTGRRCTTGASSVSKRLFFGGLPANSNAHYYYSVSIPPTFNGRQSAIIAYKVDENE